MKCSSIMKTNVECCHRDESVESAAERMRERNIGTVTDRDLAMRVLAQHRDAPSTRVQDIMSTELVGCSPGDDIEVAEELMEQHKKSRVVCVDEYRRPLGVISLSDIAHVEQRTRASEILDAVATRESPQPRT